MVKFFSCMINYLNNFNLALTTYSEVIFVTTSTTGWWWWGENALKSQLWVRVGDGIIDPISMICSTSMITNYLPTIHSMAMAGLNKTNCHSINNDGKVKKKTSTIPTSKSSPFPLPFLCPSINFGKMRMVRGLCHGRPVGGDWLGSEASPTTTLVKPAWDVENFYYYY